LSFEPGNTKFDEIKGGIMPETLSRAEYIAWAKGRALEYVDSGDCHTAIASLVSDLYKREDTKKAAGLAMMHGVIEVSLANKRSETRAVRKFIEGFSGS
jgi:hypothetical protein